ncbi:hypothetical protein MMPV_001942 [Pyropia vietnamensis]
MTPMPATSVPRRRGAVAAAAAAAAAGGAPPKRRRVNGASAAGGGGSSRPRRPPRLAGPSGLSGHRSSDDDASAGSSSSGGEGGAEQGTDPGVAAAAAAAASGGGGAFRGFRSWGCPRCPPPPGAPPPDPPPAVSTRRAALADAHFGRWEHLLRCGFGLLVHGVGSKAGLLEAYGRAMHARQQGLSVVVLRGYVPSLSLRAALASLVRRVLAVPDGTYGRRCLDDYIDAVRRALAWKRGGGDGDDGGDGGSGLMVIVHNIDGPGLRDARSQAALAALAAVPGVSLLASVDHVNAGLLVPWGGGYWAYDHVETGEPYTAEAAYYVDVLNGGGGGEGPRDGGGW